MDAGSSDETIEIIRRYEDRLAWWVSEPDDGQSDAINKGLERTSGEIVAYLNSDDYFLPGAFETAVAALEESQRSWVAGGAFDVEEGSPPKRLRVWRPKPPTYCEGRVRGRHWWMLVPWHVPQPSSFWRRDLFERFGGFREDMHYAFDAEFMLRLAFGDELPAAAPQRLSRGPVRPPRAEDLRDDELVARDPSVRGDLHPAAQPAGEGPDAALPGLPRRDTGGVGALAGHAAPDPLRARPLQARGHHPDADLGRRSARARARALAAPGPDPRSPCEAAADGGRPERAAKPAPLPDRAGARHERPGPGSCAPVGRPRGGELPVHRPGGEAS